MQKHSTQLWLLALALGWLFDLLFWQHIPGISFAIFTLLTLTGGILILWRADIRPARNTWILVFLIIFFSSFSFLRLEPLTSFLSYLFTLLLLALLAISYQNGRWPLYSIPDYLVKFLALLGGILTEVLILQAQEKQKKKTVAPAEKRSSAFWPIARGILFAIPVLFFFTSLLSSADLVFAQRITALVEVLSLEHLPEYLFRLIYSLIFAYLIAGSFLHAARPISDEKLIGLEKPFISTFMGFTEATIVLGSVVVLFASFVLVQFQYFFGGRENIVATGFTFSEYARRGFGELVAVAFFSLLLFLSLSAITHRQQGRQRLIFSGLGVFLFALVGVMLVSAFQRLVLYEIAYGFTRLRAYTHIFILWLGLLLLTTIALELSAKQRYFTLAALLGSIGFAASLMLVNVDGFIVRENVARQESGQNLDVGYLASLSPDAVPSLVELYQAPTLEQSTRDRVGAALACIQQQEKSKDPLSDWQSFHLSRFQAAQSMKLISLVGYKFDPTSANNEVSTPQGQTYSCWQEWFD
jgi:hypothetical protein